MGIETALIAGAAAGGLGGAAKGAKGTPSQTQTQTTSIQGPGAQEQQLQSQSLANYMQQQNLAKGLEGQIGATQSFQDLARQGAQGLIGGEAFALSPEEQARIQSMRDALIQQGTANVGFQTQQGLQQAVGSAAGRGLRGQALGSLQARVLESQQRNVADIANQANTLAAQQALQMPMQRVGLQQGMIGQGMTLADQLRQQAIQNREALQNPVLMNALQRDRLANTTTTQVTPGQKGSLGAAIAGGMAGAAGGAANMAGLGEAFRNVRDTRVQSQLGGVQTTDQNLLNMRRNFWNS